SALVRARLAAGAPAGAARQLGKGGAVSAFAFGQDFAILLNWSQTAPAEIFRITRATMDTPRALTRENESWIKDVAFEKPERLTVAGAGGTPIQYWLLKPPNFDASKKY